MADYDQLSELVADFNRAFPHGSTQSLSPLGIPLASENEAGGEDVGVLGRRVSAICWLLVYQKRIGILSSLNCD
jgi:hypothetical protein